MKLNKIAKGLMLALPILAITACTTKGEKAHMIAEAKQEQLSADQAAQAKTRAILQELQKSNVVYFSYDKYDIHSDFAVELDAHAAFLRSHPSFNVVLEGHADERGTPEYNIALGERRANAVKMYLQGRGVSANQITVVSYGKEKPAVLGHDALAYAKNRRAVIVY